MRRKYGVGALRSVEGQNIVKFSFNVYIETKLILSQSQLNWISGLETLSIEREIVENLDFTELLRDFVNMKDRKVSFGF